LSLKRRNVFSTTNSREMVPQQKVQRSEFLGKGNAKKEGNANENSN